MDRCRRGEQKRGAVLVWTACSLTALVGITALSVDVGYTYAVRGELQRTADAAAMAAASRLASAEGDLYQVTYDLASEYAGKNEAGGVAIQLSAGDVELGRGIPTETGMYTFESGGDPPDAVKVTVRRTANSPNGALPLFFGAALGLSEAEISASAVAMLVPRDIVVVMDLSNSMSYDSQLKHESETQINIQEVWEDLGSPTFGNMSTFHNNAGEMPYWPSKSVNRVKEDLGLDSVPYPYPRGSWNDYIRFVKYRLDDRWRDSDEKQYEDRYGLRTWTHYLLDRRHLETETPALADARVQPVHAMKQAVETLMQYLTMVDSADQVGLVSYDETARVIEPLTFDYPLISQTGYSQQAGGNGSATNIANGIQRARQELTSSRARDYAKKVMIVLTDGRANRPGNRQNARTTSINCAQAAVNQGIQIYSISLGSDADQDLMGELADMGSGTHYHVPTLDIAQYEQQLQDVFRTLGGKRPVRLIQ